MPAEMMRAAVSVELPAANGTTTVMGRVGQLCAHADVCADAEPIAARAASAPSATRIGWSMASLFLRRPGVFSFASPSSNPCCS